MMAKKILVPSFGYVIYKRFIVKYKFREGNKIEKFISEPYGIDDEKKMFKALDDYIKDLLCKRLEFLGSGIITMSERKDIINEKDI